MNSGRLRVAIAAFTSTVVPVLGRAPLANAAGVETIALTCPQGPSKARTSHSPKGSYGKYCTDSSMQGKYFVSHSPRQSDVRPSGYERVSDR